MLYFDVLTILCFGVAIGMTIASGLGEVMAAQTRAFVRCAAHDIKRG